MRYLQHLGVGAVSVVNQHPAVLGYRMQNMEAAVTFLHQPGAVLSHSGESMEGTVSYMQKLEVKIPKVVKRHRAFSSYSEQKRNEMVAYLEGLGADVTKVVKGHPEVFGESMEKMKATVAYLQELGVDVAKVVNVHQQVFGYSMENMNGMDVTKVVYRAAVVFGRGIENVKGTVAYLEDQGVDVTKVLNRRLEIFGLSIEDNIQPKVEFLTTQMQRSVSEISGHPPFLCYSLKSRIQPRYRYLQHVDHNTGCSLSYMVSPKDERFATVVAGTTLEEYITWRSKEFDHSNGPQAGTVPPPMPEAPVQCGYPKSDRA